MLLQLLLALSIIYYQDKTYLPRVVLSESAITIRVSVGVSVGVKGDLPNLPNLPNLLLREGITLDAFLHYILTLSSLLKTTSMDVHVNKG